MRASSPSPSPTRVRCVSSPPTRRPPTPASTSSPAGQPQTQSLLRRAGSSEVVDPEFEASLEFVRHVLHRFGVDGREIVALQTRWRAEYYRNE